MGKRKLSEGEKFISEYFKYSGIEYDCEVKLKNLKDDNKGHREPDFYLPKYKIYVEFNGKWNTSDLEKERYREKKVIYYRNNIPCIYLYPENLGIIDFVFTNRLIEELKKHSLKKELFRFQTKRFIDDRGALFLWLFLSIFILFGDFNWDEDRSILLIFFGIIIFQVYRLIVGVKKFYVENEIQF
ncbi:MAG TPA: hypothetical protein VGA80_02400 [Flavobacteriaceae bacterium]|jgi:hypothetical protein